MQQLPGEQQPLQPGELQQQWGETEAQARKQWQKQQQPGELLQQSARSEDQQRQPEEPPAEEQRCAAREPVGCQQRKEVMLAHLTSLLDRGALDEQQEEAVVEMIAEIMMA